MPQDRVLAFYFKCGTQLDRKPIIHMRDRLPVRVRVGGPWSVIALTDEWYYVRPVDRLPLRKRHAYAAI
jgi:hypothetical protein